MFTINKTLFIAYVLICVQELKELKLYANAITEISGLDW